VKFALVKCSCNKGTKIAVVFAVTSCSWSECRYKMASSFSEHKIEIEDGSSRFLRNVDISLSNDMM